MDDAQFAELAGWIAKVGLAGETETAMVAGFCRQAVAMGLPLARVSVFIDTLHPIYEGRLFSWQASDGEARLSEYGPSGQGEASERWRQSPFYRLLQSGEPLLRRRLSAGSEAEFPILAEITAAGMTDYVAMVNRFAAEGIIGEMDCVYSAWATDVSQGFCDDDIADLERLVPLLALAVKSASLRASPEPRDALPRRAPEASTVQPF